MRLLLGLAVFQTALIAFLSWHVLRIDARGEPAENAPAPAYARTVDRAPAGPDSAEIRRIVREEFAGAVTALAAANAGDAGQPKALAPRKVAQQSAGGADDEAQQGAVLRDIDNFIFRGRIENAEMAELQMKIARLPAPQRRAALLKITQAINAGDVDAQF